ncbi:MAG: hypothetical protein II959_07795, partial [Clostridia bacterium]|nr:hypothetical protein [Clostridia bacterium]
MLRWEKYTRAGVWFQCFFFLPLFLFRQREKAAEKEKLKDNNRGVPRKQYSPVKFFWWYLFFQEKVRQLPIKSSKKVLTKGGRPAILHAMLFVYYILSWRTPGRETGTECLKGHGNDERKGVRP